MIVAAVVSRKANCNFRFYGKIGNKKDCAANRIDKNGNNRIEVSA